MNCPSCGAYGVSGASCYHCGAPLALADDRRSAQARLEEKPHYRDRATDENRRSWTLALVGALLFCAVMLLRYWRLTHSL